MHGRLLGKLRELELAYAINLTTLLSNQQRIALVLSMILCDQIVDRTSFR
jgi:hypothetical protein